MITLLKLVARALAAPALVLGLSLATPLVSYAATAPCAKDATVNVPGGPGAGANCAAPIAGAQNLFGPNGVFITVTNIMLFIIGAIAVVMLIIGGIRYVVSSGDQNAVTGAKNTILYAIIGIIVAFLAYAAVNFVTSQISKGNV
jgi:multisubunit Na+/H+ antiporter MnhB subunit